ncbi:hypothetical protein PR048_004165 [Dryococelus australis]|uniref:MADF domain-containing protein n=1 Tax=Dryococelus australis TaxID=614101 RepID=A0ABQ9I561_9NEOP|nr:hypothetical protein PR048_004165 [Dryococelus australis]
MGVIPSIFSSESSTAPNSRLDTVYVSSYIELSNLYEETFRQTPATAGRGSDGVAMRVCYWAELRTACSSKPSILATRARPSHLQMIGHSPFFLWVYCLFLDIMLLQARHSNDIVTTSSNRRPGIVATSSRRRSGIITTSSLRRPGIMTSSRRRPIIVATSIHRRPGIITTSSRRRPGIMTSSRRRPVIVAPSSHRRPGIITTSIRRQARHSNDIQLRGRPGIVTTSSRRRPSIITTSSHRRPGIITTSSRRKPGIVTTSSRRRPNTVGQQLGPFYASGSCRTTAYGRISGRSDTNNAVQPIPIRHQFIRVEDVITFRSEVVLFVAVFVTVFNMEAFRTEQLIDEVKKKTSLWDTSSGEYKNRQLNKMQWTEVCTAFYPDFHELGAKEKAHCCKLFIPSVPERCSSSPDRQRWRRIGHILAGPFSAVCCRTTRIGCIKAALAANPYIHRAASGIRQRAGIGWPEFVG